MIVLKDKSTISVRVVEEEKESIMYILQDDPEKIVKELAKDEFKKVKYEKMEGSL